MLVAMVCVGGQLSEGQKDCDSNQALRMVEARSGEEPTRLARTVTNNRGVSRER